ANREAWRAVAAHFVARYVLDDGLRKPDVVQELVAGLFAGPLVRLPVARELVPRIRDAAHEVRIALGDPAEREERRGRIGIREQREDALDVALDAAFPLVPFAASNMRRECGHLEIILDV